MRAPLHSHLLKSKFSLTRPSSRLPSPFQQRRTFCISSKLDVKTKSLVPTQPPANFPTFTPDQLSNKREYFRYIASNIALRPFWGLPIFRVSYGDDGLWDSYLKALYEETYKDLVEADQEYLSPYFFCPIFSDPSLQGASHDTIREKFRKWAVDTRDPGVDPRSILSEDGFDDGPQESACFVVDDYCLKKFAELQHEENKFGETAPIVVLTREWDIEMYRGQHRAEYTDGITHRLIIEEHNAACEDPEDLMTLNEEHYTLFDEVDGVRVPVLGWMWMQTGYVASLYQDLLGDSCYREAWYKAYARPPRVYPDYRDGYWKL